MPTSAQHKQARRQERQDKKNNKAARRREIPKNKLRAIKKSRRATDKQSLGKLTGPVCHSDIDDLYADPPPKKVSVNHEPSLRRRSRPLAKKRQTTARS